MKTVNRSVVVSIAWLFGSIFVVIFGLWHCSSTSYNYKMSCDAEKCSFEYPKGSLWEPTVTLERVNILYAENVHWDDIKKAQVDTKGMASRKISKLGMTVAVKYNQYLESNPDQKELRTLVFPPVDMGRRKARQTLRKVKEYLNEKEDKDELDQQHGKMVTALGVVCIIFGITSVILSLALGSWKDEKLQRVRRNFVKGRMKRRD
jgi:hypothetical protein